MTAARTRRLAAAALATALALAADAPVSPAADPAVARAVRDLGHPTYRVREAAGDTLVRIGAAAVPQLHAALDSPDPEVVARARVLIDRIVFASGAGMPRAVRDLLARARAGGPNSWPSVVPELLDLGADGYVAARKLPLTLPPTAQAEQRRDLDALIDREGWRVAASYLISGNLDAAEPLLAAAARAAVAADADPMGARAYASFLRRTGRLAAALPRWVAWMDAPAQTGDAPEPKMAAAVVVSLARAAGNPALARRAAELTGRPRLVEAALLDAGAWADLAKLPVPDDGKEDENSKTAAALGAIAAKAMYLRFAGDAAAADEASRALRDWPDENGGGGLAPWIVFRCLMLDGRVDAALAYAEGNGAADLQAAKLDVLVQRGRWDDAKKQFERTQQPGLLWDTARLRYVARTQGHAAAEAFAAGLAPPRGASRVTLFQLQDQLDHLVALGLPDAARKQCAIGLASGQPAADLLDKLFPLTPLAAEAWVGHLGAAEGKSPANALELLPELLDARLSQPANEARLLAGLAAARAKPKEWRRLAGFAEACQAAGQTDRAAALFADAATGSEEPAAWVRRGDFHLDREQWAAAGAAYGEAARRAPRLALPRWLLGFAQERAGDATTGAANRELAHRLSLGDEEARNTFIDDLGKRTHLGDAVDAALRDERRELATLAAPNSNRGRNAVGMLSGHPLAFATRLEAAGQTERFLVRMVRTNAYFRRAEGYVSVLARRLNDTARGRLSAGDVAGMHQAAEAYHALWPTTVDLPTHLVPDLAKAGKAADADRVFAPVAAVLAAECERFPQSGYFPAQAAWLRARCRRDLPQAVRHARRAVELEPHVAYHHDTLAEALLQSGDAAEALVASERALALEPRSPYYRKQRDRVKAGDRDAALPVGR